LEPVKEAIDQMLESDRQAPRKQRHTAHRIWTRLCEEHPEHAIGEPTVRRYVRLRKQELGLGGRMQQDRTIAFEPVVQTSALKTWHIIVAVFLFACVIYGIVWWARRHPEIRGDHPDSSEGS
jgi:hypothetical protein